MNNKRYSYSSKWEKKKQTAGKEFYERSRMWQNHYDPGVHHQPWLSPGRQPDHHHCHDQSGLYFDMRKAKQYGDEGKKEYVYEEISKRMQKMRKFKEYELIAENEYLVSVEYCHNCDQHRTSTRHDEDKYLRQANKVKRVILQNFPNCQVLLKPLLITQNSKSIENRYLQKRLGCCEVQLCHKKRGQGSHNINYTLFKLHSKLESKTWPKPRKIVEKMQKQMPKFVFYVQVQSQGQEQLEEVEEGNNEEFKKLEGLKVELIPYRNSDLCEQNTSPSHNMSMSRQTYRVQTAKGRRPVSGKKRPISAYSQISNRPQSGYNRRPQTSQVPVKRSRPMTGMSQKSRRGGKRKSKKKVKNIQEVTDERGIAIFENVSLDIYVVKVSPNQNFMNESQVINLFELHEVSGKHNMTTTIRLRSQAMAFCHIKLFGENLENQNSKEKFQYMEKISNADVQLYLDTSEENEDRATVVKEKTHAPGDYSVVLEPGFYWCVVSKRGYANKKKRIVLKKGENVVKITLSKQDVPEQLEGMEGVVGLQLFDAFNKQPIVGATVTLKNTKKKTVISELSKKDGTCKIVTDPIKFGMLIIVKEGYLLIKEEIDPSHLTYTQLQNIAFPMIKKPEGENDVRVVFFSQDEVRKLDIFIVDPEGQHHTVDNSHGGIDNGTSVISLLDVSKKQGIYRFYAKILDPNLVQNETFLKIFYFNCDTVQVIESPIIQHKSHLQYWDLGFINCPNDQFIIINAFTSSQDMFTDLFLREYQSLCKFLIESTFGLEKLLGFTHKDARVEGNDRFVSKQRIQYSLDDTYGFVSNDGFLDHLLYSACTSRGDYSFNKLKLKLKKAMDAVQQQPFAQPLENEEENAQQLYGDEDDMNIFNDNEVI